MLGQELMCSVQKRVEISDEHDVIIMAGKNGWETNKYGSLQGWKEILEQDGMSKNKKKIKTMAVEEEQYELNI